MTLSSFTGTTIHSALQQFTLPYLPEPVDLLAVLGVMPVDGVLLPVGQIDLLHPAQHQLQRTERMTFAVQADVLNPASLRDSSGDEGGHRDTGTEGQGSANSKPPGSRLIRFTACARLP